MVVTFVEAGSLELRQTRVAKLFLVIRAQGLKLAVLIFVPHTWSSVERGSPFLRVRVGAQR